MKLVIVSDLHLEGSRNPVETFERMMDFDHVDYSDCVGIFAGDIMTGYKAPEFLTNYLHLFKYIIFIPGNHDLWYASTDDIGSHELDIAGKSVVIDGVRFTGAVGWPMQHERSVHPLDELEWANSLYEREMIQHNGGEFTYSKMTKLAHYDMRHVFDPVLPDELDDCVMKQVVITHYLPSWQSISPRFENSPINHLFASNHDKYGLFENCGIDLFIHGHSHYPVDYYIGDTRVYSNPHGYHFEYLDFSPKIIEI